MSTKPDQVQKTTDSIVRSFIYDGLDIVQESSDENGTASQLIGDGLDELWMRVESSGPSFPLTDGLGSILEMRDGAGAVVSQFSYGPFGETRQSNSGGRVLMQYTGRERDSLGLYFYRARYYDSGMARFISEDPIGLDGGLNFYTYVSNDPIDARDPVGTQSVNITSLVEDPVGTLEELMARCDGQRGYGCGGIRKWNVTCKCVPDAGCGCYRAKISMSGEEYITALTHPANTTYQEIVHEEMKHVNAARAVLQGLRKDAATMEGRTFRWKFMCEFACSQFRGRATKELADAVSRVHVTDPHPKVMTPGPSEWGFPIRRQD